MLGDSKEFYGMLRNARDALRNAMQCYRMQRKNRKAKDAKKC